MPFDLSLLSGTPAWFTAIVTVVGVLLGLLAAAYIAADRPPSSAIGWVLAVVFIPYVGLLAFLLIGSPRLPRRRRKVQREVNDAIIEETSQVRPLRRVEGAEGQPWLRSLHHMNHRLGAMPVMRGNEATIVADYEQSLAGMVADIDAARRYVHAEFYILALDDTTAPFFDALERAVARGVVVRVLFDHLASLRVRGHRAMLRRLTDAGVQWRRMLPLGIHAREFCRPDLRNHRKILVLDGAVAHSGSQNVIDASYGKKSNRRKGLQWVDIMGRFSGPVALALDAVFATDWYSETGEIISAELFEHHGDAEPAGDLEIQVVPSGPGFELQNNLYLFVSLLHAAQREVAVVSPYFVPDESLLLAICGAAERGLTVDLFVSEQGDQWLVHHAQRSYYEKLLRAGVRIWLYPAPNVLHAKVVRIDDDVAVIGSSNMDMRSFMLNLEVSVMVDGPEFVGRLRSVEQRYRDVSKQLQHEDWTQRPLPSKVVDNVARLASALV